MRRVGSGSGMYQTRVPRDAPKSRTCAMNVSGSPNRSISSNGADTRIPRSDAAMAHATLDTRVRLRCVHARTVSQAESAGKRRIFVYSPALRRRRPRQLAAVPHARLRHDDRWRGRDPLDLPPQMRDVDAQRPLRVAEDVAPNGVIQLLMRQRAPGA